MKKLLFAFAVMCIGLISTVQGAENLTEPVGGADKIKNEVAYVDQVQEYEPSGIMAYSVIPDWLNDGSREVYNSLATEENGEAKQALYSKIYRVMYAYVYDSEAKTTQYTNSSGVTARYLSVRANDEYRILGGWTELFKIYHGVLEDNPQFFYISGGGMGFSSGTGIYLGMGIPDEYLNGANRIAEVDAITEGIAEYDAIIDETMSNYVIEKKVHDKLVLDNNYSYGEDGKPSTGRFAHSIAGSLNKKYGGGVCESYAKTFDLLMNRYDVPCFYAAGTANGGGHAWNYVQLDDGNWYCVDSTWDDPVSTSGTHYLRYTYFNMPNADFHANRVVGGDYMSYENLMPQCSDSKAYYTASPNTIVGTAPNGDRVFKAPDVSEEETRTVTTVAETSTETTTKAYEYSTEVTTCNLQVAASDSVKKIILEKENGNWVASQFNTGTPIVMLSSGSGELSVVTDGVCTLTYTAQLRSATAKLYLDGQEVKTHTSTERNTIIIPQGLHKISWVFEVQSGGQGILYNLTATDKGDVDENGVVDLKDVITIFGYETLPADGELYADINGDGVVGSADAAMLLKKIAGTL